MAVKRFSVAIWTAPHRREADATAQLRRELETASRNLLRAENEGRSRAVAAEFEGLKKRKQQIEIELGMSQAEEATRMSVDAEIAAALSLALRLGELADQQDSKTATEAIRWQTSSCS